MLLMSGQCMIFNRIFEKYTLLPLTPNNFLSVINTAMHRGMTGLSGDQHPSSSPYLSGDSFAKIADYAFYEKKIEFDPRKVKEGDTIFVNAHLLKHFFYDVHPNIRFPYILITQNGDLNINLSQTKYLDQKIIHWYAQNLQVVNPKLTSIPIGLENLSYYNHGIPSLFDSLRMSNVTKIPKILYGFSVSTNVKERKKALAALSRLAISSRLSNRLNSKQYLNTLNKYMFVASPPGNGLDCHRTWEALYLNVVPIVLRSCAMESFSKAGIPLLIIDDWDELCSLSELDLQNTYDGMKKKFNSPVLWMPYWKKKIHHV